MKIAGHLPVHSLPGSPITAARAWRVFAAKRPENSAESQPFLAYPFLHVSTLEVSFFKTLSGVFHIYACNLNVHIQNRESGHVFNGRLYPLLYLLADLRNIVAVF